ncbi:hypothetical protein Vretifemale_20985 [Volvox reticuliferus]|uniref:Uncharacterized protein n=1 Tax=Volvox reticuliferus TaxID=1737510 RepID=A0A8J4G263_9CHLO|nr:hypothetical protein Vretifemale_20985 [Volvox reticuliferus]
MPSDVARSNDARALVANLDSGPQYGKNDKIIYATDYSGRSSASSSARLKDVADSYLRQLHGGNTAARVLAAQGLGSLPSFLGPTQGADALRRAIELGVLGGLIDVLMMDDKMPVQEACLMSLAALLVSTAPYEDHSSPVRPLHLKLLGASVLRPEVVTQIGHLLFATTNSRVVLAAARVVAITAPYITQANDIYILDSRVVPALLAAAAARPDPNGGDRRTCVHAEGDGGNGVPAVTSGSITQRDAAVCVLALLTLAQATPDLYATVCTAEFLQAVCVLYEGCIDPGQTSDVVLPADAAALLLRAATLAPSPRWLLPKLPPGHTRTMERNLLDSNVLDCLVSFVAVETGNLRKLGDDLAAAAAGNAAAVVDRNRLDMEQLQMEVRNWRQQLAEARVALQDALRKPLRPPRPARSLHPHRRHQRHPARRRHGHRAPRSPPSRPPDLPSPPLFQSAPPSQSSQFAVATCSLRPPRPARPLSYAEPQHRPPRRYPAAVAKVPRVHPRHCLTFEARRSPSRPRPHRPFT